MKGWFGVPSNGPVNPFGADGSNITLFLLKTCRDVRKIKERTFAVLLQSGLDEKWWANSMDSMGRFVTICETFKISFI